MAQDPNSPRKKIEDKNTEREISVEIQRRALAKHTAKKGATRVFPSDPDALNPGPIKTREYTNPNPRPANEGDTPSH